MLNSREKTVYFRKILELTITFRHSISSAGITLYFADEHPAELTITWYTLSGSKLDQKTFYPDNLVYACVHQVANYGKVVIEFVRTRLPKRYIKLRYILYGRYIEWTGDVIKTARYMRRSTRSVPHYPLTQQAYQYWMLKTILISVMKMDLGGLYRNTGSNLYGEQRWCRYSGRNFFSLIHRILKIIQQVSN